MGAAGMITEYNPMHGGHVRLIREARRVMGPETAVVCCMSGDYVQRGDLAIVRRQVRARAAVESGADLVLELPLPWAVSSAEGFAAGAVMTLAATGVVDRLFFGSERGGTDALRYTAELLDGPEFPGVLREELRRGDSFPAARTRAAARLAGDRADVVGQVLSAPNALLGVEYCRAIHRTGAAIIPTAVPRTGAGHHDGSAHRTRTGDTDDFSLSDFVDTESQSRQDAAQDDGSYPSSTAIRSLLRAGRTREALSLMTPPMAAAYRSEAAAGRAPVLMETVERAVLARLRGMTRADFALLDGGREGVSDRLFRASRTAVSVRGVLEAAKTKRYPLARLRRMVLWAWLGLIPADCPAAPPYVRPLALSRRGAALLARMKKTAAVPILSRPGDVRRMGTDAERLFTLEARAADLYALAYPNLTAAEGGRLWRERPWTGE